MPYQSTRIRLAFKCEKLVNKDFVGKSDPIIFVDLQEDKGVFTRIGETEVLKNNLNPVFKKNIDFNYIFEQKQRLRITVLDVDDIDNPPKEYIPKMKAADLLGIAEVSVAEIMGSRNWTVTKQLSAQVKDKDYGTVTIMGLRLDDTVRPEDTLALKLKGITLAAKDHYVFQKDSSDPYYTISRLQPDIKVLCKSEVISQELDPEWKEMHINLVDLCGGDLTRDVRIDVTDWDKMTTHDPIGWARFPVERLLRGETIQLIDHKDPPRPEVKPGMVQALETAIYRTPTFMDYMAEGLEIQLVVAVDFTRSNGLPAEPNSLHMLAEATEGLKQAEALAGLRVVRGPSWEYADQDGGVGSLGEILGPDGPGWVRVQWLSTGQSHSYRCGDEAQDLCAYRLNRYQRAMLGIAPTLLDLDQDKVAKAFGFGADLSRTGKANFAFPLSTSSVDVTGIKGLMDAYDHALRNFTFGEGGTMMAEMINKVVSMSRETLKTNPQRYHVLLILTDGDVDDHAVTTDAIVAASELPVSIIVAGLNGPGHTGETYEQWRKIDEGARTLKDGAGHLMARDTVTFINIDEEKKTSEDLAELVLAELKRQLLKHFELKNITPVIWQKDKLRNYRILANMPKV